jgi:hypothetical protein
MSGEVVFVEVTPDYVVQLPTLVHRTGLNTV